MLPPRFYCILTWWFGGPRYITPLPTDINLYIFRGATAPRKIYRLISKILHEAKPSVIFYDIERGNHPEWNIPHIPRGRLLAEREKRPRGMCGIFHEGWFPSSISLGNGVIYRGPTNHQVHILCIILRSSCLLWGQIIYYTLVILYFTKDVI